MVAASQPDDDDARCSIPKSTICDVNSTELEPLVLLCRQNQTEQARKGVQTYKPSTTVNPTRNSMNPAAGPREATDREKLACRIGAIKIHANEWGSSTGLNRAEHWKEQAAAPSNQASVNGNSANAEVVAKGWASDVGPTVHILNRIANINPGDQASTYCL